MVDLNTLETSYLQHQKVAEKALKECHDIKTLYWEDFFEKIILFLEKHHQNKDISNISITKSFVDCMVEGYSEEFQLAYKLNGVYQIWRIGILDKESFDFQYQEKLIKKYPQRLVEKNIMLLFHQKQNTTDLFKLDNQTIYHIK